MIEHRKCKKCGEEMRVQPLDAISGEEGSLKVTLRNMPAMVCPQGHKNFPYPEFAALLLDSVAEEEKKHIPAGEKHGLVIKHFHCSHCGGELKREQDHRESYEFAVGLKETAPFSVEFNVPVYACSACGRKQVHSTKEIAEFTPIAMVNAFKSANIGPG
jgi:Zn ribbon nucleic-acid-binding protein